MFEKRADKKGRFFVPAKCSKELQADKRAMVCGACEPTPPETSIDALVGSRSALRATMTLSVMELLPSLATLLANPKPLRTFLGTTVNLVLVRASNLPIAARKCQGTRFAAE